MITYNGQHTGDNIILLEAEETTDNYILALLTNPCTGLIKSAVINLDECNGKFLINFQGVVNAYEDLLAGLIYFNTTGSWETLVYTQDNPSNTDPDNATFIRSITLQIV